MPHPKQAKKACPAALFFEIIGALPRHPDNSRRPINITAFSQRLAKGPLSFDPPAIGLALGDEGCREARWQGRGDGFGGGC
jgi:hypothetical protein